MPSGRPNASKSFAPNSRDGFRALHGGMLDIDAKPFCGSAAVLDPDESMIPPRLNSDLLGNFDFHNYIALRQR
jgi:hypothetical protein